MSVKACGQQCRGLLGQQVPPPSDTLLIAIDLLYTKFYNRPMEFFLFHTDVDNQPAPSSVLFVKCLLGHSFLRDLVRGV